MADVVAAEGEAAPAAAPAPAPAPAATEAAGAVVAEVPQKFGYAVFPNFKAAKEFFKVLLSSFAKNVDLNEYEHLAMLDLLKLHPEPERKHGVGVRAFQIRVWSSEEGKRPSGGGRGGKEPDESRAFHVVRKDGSIEDFSYLKCLATLYPGQVTIHTSNNNNQGYDSNKRARTDSGHGGRGGGGGRGRGGRGGSPRGGGRGRHRH